MSESVDPYELRARLHRIMAGRLRVAAAQHDMAASAVMATKSLKGFTDAWNASVAREVAEHPDLAELNVQMHGFYGVGPVRPDEEPTP
ncbi:hypothetical protein J7I98_23660 [Streptomyces sp. ISL-98]|uniref:hypothetical protein n=1 Tax=Streptomyces sp. ISL-98 TaxID=2819192 RepID=UPI001BEC2C98|nr:hypothetical protein [Streptomyces sp. ISL-98]MBT2508828.1 hypothetical protein [Streptomyces sp. ISL-98]